MAGHTHYDGLRINHGNAKLSKLNHGSKTHDFASVASGAVASTTVTVTGAALGDFALAWMSIAIPAGAFLAAQVTAADTVTVTLVNLSGGAVDLASATLYACASKAEAY